MSILLDSSTHVIVQGITGAQARFDTEWCLRYGTRIVAGVTPGRGGEKVHGVAVFDTVRRATEGRAVDASVLYVPPAAVKSAVLEALDAHIRLIVVTAEYVPQHDVVTVVAAARRAGAHLVGCNTNGLISPGQSKLGGIGGMNPAEIFLPGTVGVVSRSGGMVAEIGLALKDGGYGISSAIGMGGDAVTGMRMADYLRLFEQDPGTEAIVFFGEPGTDNEQEVAALVASGATRKPVIGMVAGEFQERYPPGISFGHAAAMITDAAKSASAKRALLREAGVHVVLSLEDISPLLRSLLR